MSSCDITTIHVGPDTKTTLTAYATFDNVSSSASYSVFIYSLTQEDIFRLAPEYTIVLSILIFCSLVLKEI